MFSEEAESVTEPRSTIMTRRDIEKRYKPIERVKAKNKLIVYFLFVIIIILCSSNFLIYNSYKGIQNQYGSAFQNARQVVENKQAIQSEKEKLSSENKKLNNDYEALTKQNKDIMNQLQSIKSGYDELNKKNNELIADNIALQNSLKQAAAVGIKPQNYRKFSGISSRGEITRGEYVGKFFGTAYTPSAKECGNNAGITNSGKPIIPGISVAIDNKYWPFGTVFYIRGLGYAVAMDTGSAIKGKNRFDFAVFDKKFASTLGAKYWDVYLVKLGNGSLNEVKF